jgi:broad specificity phosphatase PhoE
MSYELSTELWRDPADEFDPERMEVLQSAVDKLIRFGEQVGVNPEEMVLLLDSGMTVRGLLYYLVSQSSLVN